MDVKNDDIDASIATLGGMTLRGSDNVSWKLVKPNAGFLVKTWSENGEKIFLNICHMKEISAPQDVSELELMDIWQSEDPTMYWVPMSIGDLREERDKSGAPCCVCDIAINTAYFLQVTTSFLFRSHFLTVALKCIAYKFNKQIQTDTEDYIILKNRKVIGSLQHHRIQQRSVATAAKKLPTEEVKVEESTKDKPGYRIIRDPPQDNPELLTVHGPSKDANVKSEAIDASISTLRGNEASDNLPWELVNPNTGFMVETWSQNRERIFLNICHTKDIPAPQEVSDAELMKIKESEDPTTYQLPMSIGDLRKERDKSGAPCYVCNVAINTTFFHKVATNKLFRSFFLALAIHSVSVKYNKQNNTGDNVILRYRRVIGSLETAAKKLLTEKVKVEETTNGKPRFRIIRDPPHGNPEVLTVQVHIKDASSGKTLLLDVGEDRLVLRSAKKSGSLLDIFLPYCVDQDGTCAHFDTNTQILSVKLPVIITEN